MHEVTVKCFVGWLKKNPSHPKLIVITPEIALEGLTFKDAGVDENGDAKQRPLSGAWVRELARRMSVGLWSLTAEGLSFSWDGHCLNGQHRLHAVIESGVSIESWVFFGQDPALFPYYDGGKRRTASDIFAMRGVPSACQASSITRQVNVYHSKGYRGNSTGFPVAKTPEEAYEYYLEVGPDVVHDAVHLYSKLTSGHISKQSVIAGLYIVANELSNGKAVDFFNAIASGANLGSRSIEKKLRDHLLVNGKDMTPSKVAADVVRAWNAKRTNRRSFSTDPIANVPEMV